MIEARIPRSRSTTGVALASLAAAITLILGVGVDSANAGGVVSGTVKLGGTPPPAPVPVQVSANLEACGTEHVPEQLVGTDGSVRWAVVRVVGAKGAFPAEAPPPQLDQRGCRFTPHVIVVPVGKPLKVLNNDGILHNVHTFSEKNAPINTAQPGFRKTMDVTFEKPEILRVGCDVHPWMSAQIVATDTPFVAVTDANGAFSIEGVPPGTYDVTVWHESFAEQTLKVTVAEGKKASLTVTMAVK